MFDIGFLEILLIGVLALLVLGPERLPGAIRTVSYWMSRIRRSFQQVKMELEREVDIAELKQQIHNDTIMEKLAETKGDIDNHIQQARRNLQQDLGSDGYDLSNTFPQDSDTLPDHEPLPDPDEGLDDLPEDKTPPTSDRS